MSSSTSSSEVSPARKSLVALLCFLGGFGGMVGVGEMLPLGARNEYYLFQRTTRLDASWYLTKLGGQYALLAEDNPFLDSARRADILLLGNSMLMYAFRGEQVRRLEQRTGARVFHLGFGFEERCDFPLKLIRDHDLRPKMVVVNADDFFLPGYSEVAGAAIAEARVPEGLLARWRRATELFEDWASRKVRAALQPWLPRWFKVLPMDREALQVHRSTVDGTWLMTGLDDVGRSRPMGPEWNVRDRYDLSPAELATLREFGEEMDRRGVLVVLTLVQHSGVLRPRARRAAEVLGAPLIAPRLDGLSTLDDFHLDRESAARWVTAFLEELEALDEFRELRRALAESRGRKLPAARERDSH